MNRDTETVPARHETPDVAELRRLYEEAMCVGSNEMAWDEWTTVISEAAEDLFDAAAERDALAAKVESLADWHETKADKARRFRIEINGRNPVMDKAAEVHADAARRLRRALDEEPQP